MKAVITIIVVLGITSNASNRLDSVLGGTEISIGPCDSSVSIGNITEAYPVLEPKDIKASKNAVLLVELLRRMFGVGIFNLPPLDPFTTNDLKPLVLGSDTFISGKILLHFLTMTGAKNFDLKLLQLRMKTGRVDFEMSIPEINFNVDFETDLYLGGIIPFYLNGQSSGKINELRLTGALQTEVRPPKGSGPNVVYQVSGVTVHVRANDVKVSLVKGIHIDKDLLETIYAGEDKLSLSRWIDSTKDMITKYAVNTFISLANDVLRELSSAQVNAFLLPEGEA